MNQTGDNLLDALNDTVNNENGPVQKAIQTGDVQTLLQLTVQISSSLQNEYDMAQAEAEKNLTDAQKQTLDNANEKRANVSLITIRLLGRLGFESSLTSTPNL